MVINVNIPYGQDDEIKGYRVTRQGLRIYRDELVRRQDPRGRPYYWIGGDSPTGVAGRRHRIWHPEGRVCVHHPHPIGSDSVSHDRNAEELGMVAKL